MTCKLCPTKKHCWDKGNCETCDCGIAFEKYNKKLKRYKTKNEQLEAENKALRQRLAETENGYAQTLSLERLKNRDLTEENNRLSVWEQGKVEAVRSHAIKEFAKRLKNDFPRGESPYNNYCLDIVLDNLVKEMTGEQL